MKNIYLTDAMLDKLGIYVEMYQCKSTFVDQAQKVIWDIELGIRHDKPPVSDREVMSYLCDTNEKRTVNPDCPPYDPRSGL